LDCETDPEALIVHGHCTSVYLEEKDRWAWPNGLSWSSGAADEERIATIGVHLVQVNVHSAVDRASGVSKP